MNNIIKARSMFHRPTKTHRVKREEELLTKPKLDWEPAEDLLDKLVIATTLLRKVLEVLDTEECRELIDEVKEILEEED